MSLSTYLSPPLSDRDNSDPYHVFRNKLVKSAGQSIVVDTHRLGVLEIPVTFSFSREHVGVWGLKSACVAFLLMS